MATPRVTAAGGFPAIRYVLGKAIESRRPWELWRRMRARNTCKTCALGMGGQRGGMRNEAGHFPEVCKKSLQAQVADMRGPIPDRTFTEVSLAILQHARPRELERLGRLAYPVYAGPGDTHLRRLSWEEALDLAGERLRAAAPERTFWYASGRASNEAAFLMQLVARMSGSPHIHNCSSYCHAASGVALGAVYGSGTASVTLADLEEADLALVIGANPASNHPRLMTQLAALRARGGEVIVVNPLRELGLTRFRVPSRWRSMVGGGDIATAYLQPHIGGDVALLRGLLRALIEQDAVDAAFIRDHTSGWEAVRAEALAEPWERLEAAAGVPRAEIEATAALLAGARRGIVMWAMGLTHHAHGVDNILALANLALARGWLGRSGAGLLPIRGHSNVQGVGSVGVSPVVRAEFAAALAERYGVTAPETPGQDTYRSMEAAARGEVDACVLLGGNLFASNPDRRWAKRALGAIPFTLALTTTLNEGHIHGRGRETLILPVLARDEEPQPTTQESMFNYVRLSDGGRPAVRGEQRSEVAILADLAERLLPPGRFDWAPLRSHAALRAHIAATVPGLEALAAIEERGEFQIPGRTFHEPRFATPDGRARFHPVALPPPPGDDAEALRLMTVRSEGQFNSVVYEEADLYRGNERRDVVMMSASDATRLGVDEGERVTVRTAAGALRAHVAIVDIRPGNLAMYYPEANALVPRRLDSRSGTPAFKSIAAHIERDAAGAPA